mmetsp:Transcript_6457/g.22044  ORF Transcript_6457/g.22044 Transcript_6457/m.22044 type:complete len:244 (+) Transcript_6457:89-820(+)
MAEYIRAEAAALAARRALCLCHSQCHAVLMIERERVGPGPNTATESEWSRLGQYTAHAGAPQSGHRSEARLRETSAGSEKVGGGVRMYWVVAIVTVTGLCRGCRALRRPRRPVRAGTGPFVVASRARRLRPRGRPRAHGGRSGCTAALRELLCMAAHPADGHRSRAQDLLRAPLPVTLAGERRPRHGRRIGKVGGGQTVSRAGLPGGRARATGGAHGQRGTQRRAAAHGDRQVANDFRLRVVH